MPRQNIVGAAVLALAVISPVAGLTIQPAPTEAADRLELTRLETVWNEAHVKGDADALDRLWASDLIVTVASMPVLNKADSLAMVRSGRMTFLKYDTSEIVIRTYGDTALVTGRVHRARKMGDRDVSDDWRFTKVYVRSQGLWRVVAWHASPRL
jgi:ketosteroid isomerase-like protein